MNRVIAPTESTRPPSAEVINPNATLWLLSIAHAVNHAQAVLLPLVYIRIIAEFGVSADTIALLAALGSFASGAVQLSYAKLTRMISRRKILGAGGILFGGGFAAQALAPGFASFAVLNVVSRVGGSPQHPVGNGLLAEQFPEERRGFAISAHISGGNVGTVIVAIVGAPLIALLDWRAVVVIFGIPAVVIALAILLFVRESGSDREAAVAHGSVRAAFRQVLADPDHRWIYLASILGGGGRGLGVVNLFALLYLSEVLLPAGVDVRGDVRGADRVLGADAARRRLALGPHRAEAGDHRRVHRRGDRVRRCSCWPDRRSPGCGWGSS